MTEMADKIAALKAQHKMPQPALVAAAAMAMIAAEPRQSKHRLGMSKTHCYSSKQWAAMKKRRKAAHAAKRRNRRG